MVQNNNICNRIIAVVIAMIISFTMVSTTSFATTNENPEITDPTAIVWEYQIVDANGNIIETGVMTNSMQRLSWAGPTLKNGETAFFRPTDKKGLYAVTDTAMNITWRLDRKAKHKASVRGYHSGQGFEVTKTATSGTKSYTTKCNDFFYGMITNLSSDSIKVKSFGITF